MRLLKVEDDGRLSLTTHAPNKIPPYAILSHTWGADEDEITFRDLIDNVDIKVKAGFAKVNFCAQQAKSDNLEFFWVDTCCIDKTSSAELSESITSMFRWYANAAKCYVYLSDIPNLKRKHGEVDVEIDDDTAPTTTHAQIEDICNSRWLTRGWTLQELIAPKQVEFFSRKRQCLGTKQSLAHLIHEKTKLPVSLLLGAQELARFSIRERISWVRNRNTQLVEDKYYCLLGILSISMPCNYGEGTDALDRLTNAILLKYPGRELFDLEHFFTPSDAATFDDFAANDTPHAKELSVKVRRKVAMESLSFETMDSRRVAIKPEMLSTCSWFLEHSTYRTWKDPSSVGQHQGLLWIRGKPGSGKSTLMKFAHEKAAKSRSGGDILVSFFFNARGQELDRTTNGMYRSLIHQVLTKVPRLQSLLDEHLITDPDSASWSIERLCSLLREVLTNLGERCCTCYIDALDECRQQQVQDMVRFFERVGQEAIQNGGQVFTCFASRHYPTIDIRHGLKLTLEDEDGHDNDLADYIHNHLRADPGDDFERTTRHLREKANGIFMWAVLVIDILKEEYDRGDILGMEKRLHEIPAGLSELFRNILLRDRNRMPEFRLCLQLLLFARRPLKPEEFYYAMLTSREPSAITKWKPGKITKAHMTKYVQSSSKGLAELTKADSSIVQFIHESVRDFLLKDKGLIELWPDCSPDLKVFSASSHDQLKDCCAEHLKAYSIHRVRDTLWQPEPTSKSPAPLSKARKRAREPDHKSARSLPPFLDYAAQNILFHADEASDTISQTEFLKSFDFPSCVNACNIFESYAIRRHNPDVSQIYFLAERNCARLIKAINGFESALICTDTRYGCPVFAAIAHNNLDATHALMPHYDRQSVSRVISESKLGRGLSFPRKIMTPVRWAIDAGHQSLAIMLMRSPAFDPATLEVSKVRLFLKASYEKKTDTEAMRWVLKVGINPLAAGLSEIFLETGTQVLFAALRLLLDRSIEISQRRVVERVPEIVSISWMIATARLLFNNIHELLAWHIKFEIWILKTAVIGQFHVFDLLLHQCIRHAVFGSSCGLALQVASFKGWTDIVGLFLDRRAEINLPDGYYGSALQLASSNGKREVQDLLLSQGVVHDASRTVYLEDALDDAIEQGKIEIVKLLLDGGADVNGRSSSARVALQTAAHFRRTEIIEHLLDCGADINLQNGSSGCVLWTASLQGNLKLVELLLDRGADVETQSEDFETALQIASCFGATDIVRLLLDRGANLNAETCVGGTALQTAALHGKIDTVGLLLHRGADVHARSSLYGSAVEAASGNGWSDVVDLLNDYAAYFP